MECRMSIEKTEAAIEAILFTMGESWINMKMKTEVSR